MTGPGTANRDRWMIVPEALRESQRIIAESAAGWDELSRWVVGHRIDANEFGWLARVSGVVAEYNDAIERIARTYHEGAQTLERYAASLDEVATAFEEQDADYYRAFGYVNRTLDRVPRRPR